MSEPNTCERLIAAAMESNEAFAEELKQAMKKYGLTAKELGEKSGLSQSLINKVIAGGGGRDLRVSTLRSIVCYLRDLESPRGDLVIGVIAARPILDSLRKQQLTLKGKRIVVREYPAISIEDAIISAIRAERSKVHGLVCAPIVASIIEKFIRVPIITIKVDETNLLDSISLLIDKITYE